MRDETTLRKEITRGVARFKKQYEAYFKRQCLAKKVVKKSLDSYPRIVLVPGLGIYAAGADAKAAEVALDIYEHTVRIITDAERLGRYEALSESHLFDLEYWSLEQAKLGKQNEKPFARKVVWISGAASGIGRATAALFGKQGAHVFMTDRDVAGLRKAREQLGLGSQAVSFGCDVTQRSQVESSFAECGHSFGGVDIVISNAGIAPMAALAECPEALLRHSFEVNFFAHQSVAQAAIKVFKQQGRGGTLLFNASKSAFNPGPGFGPYALPKAGVIALMRQYAIELGPLGIRSNAVNADRVRTRLFGEGLLARRAKARGVTVQEYLSGNLLHKEVYAEDVAQAFVSLALSAKTTGAVLPVDGGNPAAFPR